jgi:hypothetical protein
MKGRCIGGTITEHDCVDINPDTYKDYNFTSFLPGPETQCNIFRFVYITIRE